jgi:DNA-binding response OmpR family regulator
MLQSKRVLVIDDENVVCHSCRRVLEQEGYDVSITRNGRDGIEEASQEDFDAVIVDLRMPGIGGMDVLRIIRRNKPETPVIIITAYSSITTAVEAMQSGAADYLPKPFTPRELVERVDRLLRSARASSATEASAAGLSRERILVGEVEDVRGEEISGARILLAGSDTEEMAFLREYLSSEPWQVTTAEKHEEIIQMVRAGQVDVLVTGIDVLGMKAYEVIPEVKKLGSNIPIIIACADPSLELARKIREFGIFFYLMAPFDAEEVRAAVRDAVRKAAMTRGQATLPSRPSLVRCVRTVARDGTKVGFLAIGEKLDEKCAFYREITEELKRRGMPVRTEVASTAVSAREFPRYLEQDDSVVIVAASDFGGEAGGITTYSAADFEKLSTEEQRRKMKEVAFPDVLHWLNAQGIAPEVKVVCLSSEHIVGERGRKAAKTIISQVPTQVAGCGAGNREEVGNGCGTESPGN